MESKRFIIIMAVLILGMLGFIVVKNNNKTDDSGSIQASTGSANYYGKMDSPVVLTEFVDFQCEACYAYYPAVKEVKELYKDKVKFQVRNFPISSGHQFAMQAARSAEAAARQGKFWEMHDKIFESQKSWEQMKDPQSTFDSFAKEIGLDVAKYNSDRMSSEVNAVVNKDLKDVKELGGTGTPTFLLNGKRVEKNPEPTVEAFSKFLDEAIKSSES